MKVDNENMIKEIEVVEGEFLDIEFNLYSVRFEIKENPRDEAGSSCLSILIFSFFFHHFSLINSARFFSFVKLFDVLNNLCFCFIHVK